MLKVDGKTVEFASMLIWDQDAAGNNVPQILFYEGEAGCDDRATSDVPKFYAAYAADAGFQPGEYSSPNWGYTGMPDFVPSSEGDTGYPPAYFGTVTVTSATEQLVRGTVSYESKGLSVKGSFEATRCSPL